MSSSSIPDPHGYLADYTGKLATMRERVEQARESFEQARAEARSSDGSVAVTVAAAGRIESIDLTAAALRLGHVELGATIMRTIRDAQVKAAGAIEESMRPIIGDGAGMEFLREQVAQGVAEIQPEPARPDAPVHNLALPPEEHEQPSPPPRPTRRRPPAEDDGDFSDESPFGPKEPGRGW